MHPSIIRDLCGNAYEYPPMHLWGKVNTKLTLKEWARAIKVKSVIRFGLYIHIPFCQSKCEYCQFFSKAQNDNSGIDRYLYFFKKECEIYSQVLKMIPVRTIYIGGGTPSILNNKQIERLFSILRDNFFISNPAQISFESRPSTLTSKKIELLKRMGVNRLTIGVQSLSQRVLRNVNREQSYSSVKSAISTAKKTGIECVNIDLIAGLPHETNKSLGNTCRLISGLRPHSIHINPFFPSYPTKYFQKNRPFTDKDSQKSNYQADIARKVFRIVGYRNYSPYEGPSLAFVQNEQIVDSIKYISSYLGLGCSASSHCTAFLRHLNVSDFKKYYKMLAENKLPIDRGVFLSKSDEMRYYVISNLRYNRIFKRNFNFIFKEDLNEVFKKEINFLNKNGFLTETSNYIEPKVGGDEHYIFPAVFYHKGAIRKEKKLLSNFKCKYSLKNVEES